MARRKYPWRLRDADEDQLRKLVETIRKLEGENVVERAIAIARGWPL